MNRCGTCVVVMLALTASGLSSTALGRQAYRRPPEEIVRILEAPPLPAVSLAPSKDALLLVHRETMPPVADLAQPMLRLAGARINPATNGPHQTRRYNGLSILRISDGQETRVMLPPDSDVGFPMWSPNGARFIFTITRADGIEVWVGGKDTGEAQRLAEPGLNGAFGAAAQWMPDGVHVLCRFVPAGRGGAPRRSSVPSGPVIQESTGRVSPVRTFQDLLSDQHDEAMFDHVATAQLALVNVETGERTDVGLPGVYMQVEPSPDGQYLLISRVVRPYSYLVPAYAFPQVVEVWDTAGRVVRQVAQLPLRDTTPIGGVPVGPRTYTWQDTAEATLIWIEALDGGDPKREAPHRDRLLALGAPFDAEPRAVHRLEHRFRGMDFLQDRSTALVSEYDRDRRWTRTWLIDIGDGEPSEPRLVWDRSSQDRYGDPGRPITITNAAGRSVVLVDGGSIYLAGSGATPEGDRPFLDALELSTLETTRRWQVEGDVYERVVDLLGRDGSRILTQHESPLEPPNYFARDLSDGGRRQITSFTDPAPQLRNVHKELVTYERADGVTLSATLYLPADYEPGQRLPLLVWAYPREYSSAATAGQVRGSPHRFTMIGGSSHLFLLTQGYAIMDGATMPVIGDPDTMNDTFIEQIVASAQAAIDYASERGVADAQRVGVGGHSYGAFMTANLLAHCDLFQAGVARSGAYNRTLTPFGFQSEQRTFWQAPQSYFSLSPFMHADKINEPMLMIHGMIDNNSGTFPVQSERMYHAIKGHGGTTRLVMLPHESHGYRARESVMHVLAEMIDWFDTHVKGATIASETGE